MGRKIDRENESKVRRPYRLGDEVRIRHFAFPGRIIELRGPLGIGGRDLFRVLFREEPDEAFIEVPEEDLILVRAYEDIVAMQEATTAQ
jgi:hypothetical protein